MASTNSDRIRFRYGKCLNDECEKGKSKEVIQIPARKDFVCPTCGKPLRECPPPKKSNFKPAWVIGGAGVVLVALIGWLVWPSGHESKGERVLISTDTVTIDNNLYAVSVYQIGEGTERDTTFIGVAPVQQRELISTDTVTIDKNIYAIMTYRTGANTERDTTLIGAVPEKTGHGTPQTATPKSAITVPFGTYSGPASGLDGEIKVTRSYTLDLRNAAHESIELRPGDVITRTKFKNGELVGGYWTRGSQSRSFHR